MAEGPDEEIYGSTEQHVESQNKIGLNRISLNRISLNGISMNGISMNGISMNGISMNGLAALDTAEDREVIKYLVQCALPEGQTATLGDSNGNAYTFNGSIGLAPGWANGAPSESEKRWVSACLLARTNAFGVGVAISLRGDHAMLGGDAAEHAAYGLREGAFWGDVFGETIDAHACPAPAKLEHSQASTLPLRECAMSSDGVTTTCGHKYAGPCATACTDANGVYTACAGAAEVITTFVASE